MPLKVGDFGMQFFPSVQFRVWDHRPELLRAQAYRSSWHRGALWIDLLFWLFYGLQGDRGLGLPPGTLRQITGPIVGFLADFGFLRRSGGTVGMSVAKRLWLAGLRYSMGPRRPKRLRARRRGSWSPTSWACPSPTLAGWDCASGQGLYDARGTKALLSPLVLEGLARRISGFPPPSG